MTVVVLLYRTKLPPYGVKTCRSYFQNTKHPELKFRALLTDGAPEVRFERVAVRST